MTYLQYTSLTPTGAMEWLGIRYALAFDDHFRQFGAVAVVPWRFSAGDAIGC